MERRHTSVTEACRRRLCHEMWNIGVIEQPAADIVARGVAGRVRWYGHLPDGVAFADPSLLSYPDGRQVVFVEAIAPRVGRGEIWSADLAPGNDPLQGAFSPILQTPYHMSYPFPFSEAGSTVLVTESWQAQQITMWHQVAGQWETLRTLFAGRSVLDPTFWRGPDRWWLFCTFRDDGPDSRLHLFFADTLEGPWRSHPCNPVVSNRAGARPAGPLFAADDRLIRPGQDCSQTYGGAVILHEVTRLDPDGYEERQVRRIGPQPGTYQWGLHTFCPAGDVTLIDGKYWRFDYRELSLRSLRKLASLRRKDHVVQ